MNATNPNQETDTLKFTQNEDGSFTANWDPQDPKWSFLNNLTSAEVSAMIEQAIKDFTDGL
jgi:hypothetical protein